MSVYDDARLLFFLDRQRTGIVDIEKSQDLLVSFLSSLILKNFYVDAEGIILAETRGQLDFTVDRIVVFDETTDKPNNNSRTPSGRFVCGRGWRGNHWAEGQE